MMKATTAGKGAIEEYGVSRQIAPKRSTRRRRRPKIPTRSRRTLRICIASFTDAKPREILEIQEERFLARAAYNRARRRGRGFGVFCVTAAVQYRFQRGATKVQTRELSRQRRYTVGPDQDMPARWPSTTRRHFRGSSSISGRRFYQLRRLEVGNYAFKR